MPKVSAPADTVQLKDMAADAGCQAASSSPRHSAPFKTRCLVVPTQFLMVRRLAALPAFGNE
jgi:hypothetical protein